MRFMKTKIEGVQIVDVPLHWDERGFFGEALNAGIMEAAGFPFRVHQCNLSMSRERGVVRGMHWQEDPAGQTKLVLCLRGVAWDVAVDVRPGSPTYGEHVGVELWSKPDPGHGVRGLLVPKGFAHGWQALETESMLLYFVDAPWSRAYERGVRPEDPGLSIEWPLPSVVPSARDSSWPPFVPRLRPGASEI